MHKFLHTSLNVVILGGGAAGMSCALWLKNLGFTPILVEPEKALGGQLLKIERINRWVLGIPGRTGPELAKLYGGHVVDEAIDIRLGTRIESVTAQAPGFSLVSHAAGNLKVPLFARALVIATGLRLKSQELFQSIPGTQALYESGLLSFFPLDHLDSMDAWEGKRVAVIGGGDNAYFTAKDLAPGTASTHLLIRSRPTAQPMTRAEVEALIRQGLIQEHRGVQITGSRRHGGGIVIDVINGGFKPERIEVDRIFARTGFAPNTDFLAKLGPLAEVAKNAEGYVLTDASKRASLPRVYAVGDVANPDHPAVVTAIADGAVAARAIAHDLGV